MAGAESGADGSPYDDAVELTRFYQLENGTVVRVVGEARDTLTLEAVEAMERFPVKRSPFAAEVHRGVVDRVEPRWVLVGADGDEE